MATQYYNFDGIAHWAKVYKPDSKYNKYSVDLYMSDKNIDTLQKAGVTLKIREDENGKFVKFSRPDSKVIKGELVKLGPPKVEALNNGSFVPFSDLIGNGSKVRVNISVYDTREGKGHTMLGVTVLEHVKYEPDSN